MQNLFTPIRTTKAQFSKLPSPDPYLDFILEVNLNFQVRLTIILANGIFSQ